MGSKRTRSDIKNNIEGTNDFFLKTSKTDVFLIIAILFFSFLYLFRVHYTRSTENLSPAFATVYKEGRLLKKIDLRQQGIVSILNGKMRLEIKDGKIRVSDSDCPQHLCVKMGWIKYTGQTIVCVPNKISIEMGHSGSSFLDVVAY